MNRIQVRRHSDEVLQSPCSLLPNPKRNDHADTGKQNPRVSESVFSASSVENFLSKESTEYAEPAIACHRRRFPMRAKRVCTRSSGVKRVPSPAHPGERTNFGAQRNVSPQEQAAEERRRFDRRERSSQRELSAGAEVSTEAPGQEVGEPEQKATLLSEAHT